MRLFPAVIAAGSTAVVLTAAGAAPPKVQFSRQVLPLLNRECASCHRGSAAPGGYSLESAERLLAGGRHGRAVVPGKSAEGTLVRYLTGELKPQMPPGKPLPLDTIAVLRRWIDEGAVLDSFSAPAEIRRSGGAMPGRAAPQAAGRSASPFLPASVSQSAPVTALAWSPDGALLAAGGYRAGRLLDPATGAVLRTLDGPADQVLSLAWSADGKQLAAGGGVSGASGEVVVWQAAAAGAEWSRPRILKEHGDAVYAVAWRPGAAELASASLDRTARIWDTAAGTVKRVLKDHVDAVMGAAYSADGQWLATGSADRTVKLYRTDTGARVNSFSNPEGVTGVAFGPKSDVLVAACSRELRVWPVRTGSVENPLRGHGEGELINAVAYSADGSTFVFGAANRQVRLWNAEVSQQRRSMGDAPDWIYAVALSPDGKRVAAGAGDGKVYFWTAQDGKLERSVPLGPAAGEKR